MLITSEISLYFMILSADVVDVSDGEAFTFIHQAAAHEQHTVEPALYNSRPVEYQLHRIPKALTGQVTEPATGTRTADSTQVYITYDGWNMKVLVF